MGTITNALMMLLTAIAAIAVTAKNIAEYQVAKTKLNKDKKENNTETTTSKNLHFVSSFKRFGPTLGLVAIFLAIGNLGFLQFAYSSAPLTVGNAASMIQSCILFFSGIYIMRN